MRTVVVTAALVSLSVGSAFAQVSTPPQPGPANGPCEGIFTYELTSC